MQDEIRSLFPLFPWKPVRELSALDKLVILCHSNCPDCNTFMQVETEQTEELLLTTSGVCPTCGKLFMIDRSCPPLLEMLSGHAYEAQ